MGLRNWFAKNVAGARGYGESMGRSTAENGLALGRILYLAHGIGSNTATTWVFENAPSMSAKGYSVYCADPQKRPPMEDQSRLSILTRAAGVAFAAKVAMNAAQCFSRPENFRDFGRAIGAANAAYMSEHDPNVPLELVTQFVHFVPPRDVRQLLDLNKPGTDDLFGAFLREISSQNGVAVGFQRSGVVGFGTFAVTLASETVSSIQRAAVEFRW